jgi:glycerol-3-phosphate acyltransferase PlsY
MPELLSDPTALGLWALIGYLLGSIPFGMVLAAVMGLGNLRSIGAGNIGATNVLRTGNKLAAALTLILDGGKAAVAVLLARSFAGEDAAQLAGLMAFFGHCFPVWLKFKGGKGVATFLGLLLALAWPVGIAACLTWLATAVIARISSLSALVAAATSTFWMVMLDYGQMIVMGAALTLLIFWTHRANIARLRKGEEPRIGQK